MDTIITIDNFSALHAFLNIADKKDVHYYLNGVFIEAINGETRIVATNGHVLAAYRMFCANKVEDETGKVEFIIPRETLEKIKPIKGVKHATIESGEGKEMFINYAGTKVSFFPVDGTFPEYTRVIPEEVTGELAQYQPDYIMTFQKVARVITGNTKALIEVFHNGDKSGLVNIGDDNFIGVIMPFRESGNKVNTQWARKRLHVNVETEIEEEQEEVAA